MIFVNSEIAPLRKVMVHRPDDGIDRIDPKSASDLLFDDLVYLKKMKEEHGIFTDVLKLFLGDENVIEMEALLQEALETSEENRHKLIDYIVNFEEMPKRDKDFLESLDVASLRKMLITGYFPEEDIELFDPIPNFMFTRDIAAVVNDHLIVTKAAKTARFRENLLTRFIFWAHPLFADVRSGDRLINLNDVDKFPSSRQGDPVTVEGGDVMTIHPDYLLLGCSERTSAYGIEVLRDELFRRKVVKNVVQINIPKTRSYMHIDTLFTQINQHHIVAFKPLICEMAGVTVQVFRSNGAVKNYFTVEEFFHGELDAHMEFIYSGNGEWPHAEREQWMDGCNLVAIRPGVAIAYERNEKTAEALQKCGYRILAAEDFIAQCRSGKINPAKVENTIISIPSGELSRARGGSHCMTCPIWRE